MLYDDVIIQVAKRPIVKGELDLVKGELDLVKGELDLHEQLSFVWNKTHSIDTAR